MKLVRELTKKETLLCLVLAGLAHPLPANAAGPFVTDDAAIAAPHSCQLEAWKRFNRQGYEVFVLPACNPFENWELTLGQISTTVTEGERERQNLIQAKTVFRPIQPEQIAWGLSFGSTIHRHPSPGQERISSVYAYVPLSYSIGVDLPLVHFNLGGFRSNDDNRNNLTWSVAVEAPLHPRLALNVEAYGDHRSAPSYQLGAAISIVPNRVQLFLLTGGQRHNRGDNGRWATLGFSVSTK